MTEQWAAEPWDIRDDDEVPGRATVRVRGRNLADVTGEVLDHLRKRNDPPKLFSGPFGLTRARRDVYGALGLEPLDQAAVALAVADAIDTVDTKGVVNPPRDVVAALMSHAEPGLPILREIVRSPLLLPDGRVVSDNGYQQGLGLFFDIDASLRMPAIATHPSACEVRSARALLLEPLVDFLWGDPASVANAVGMLITQPIRPLFDGASPLHGITGTQPGVGKGLLPSAAGIIAVGQPVPTQPYPDGAELRKLITSILRGSPALVAFDNIDTMVKSPELARLMTSDTWGDRELGLNRALSLPNRTMWTMTGNGLTFGGDVARRVVMISLVADRADPWNRTGYLHSDLLAWIRERRGDLLGAAFTLARSWMRAGQPDSPIVHGGGFEAWSNVVGGILAHAGIDGYLSNLSGASERDGEDEVWSQLLSLLIERKTTDKFTTSNLITWAESDPALSDAIKGVLPATGRLDAQAVGAAMGRRVDRWHQITPTRSARFHRPGSAHGSVSAWLIEVSDE